MTVTRSFSKRNIVTGRFVKYRIKRSWAVMLLSFIVIFFSLVVPFLMNAESFVSMKEEVSAERFTDRVTSYFTDNMIWCIFVSSFLAIWAGCSSLSYLNNKVSAGFFHAIPERRSGHFIASLLTALADFILPFILNVLILLLAVATNGILYNFVFVLILKLIFLCVFVYLVTLAPCYLAGMLTGNTAIHAIFTFYIALILPVTYLTVGYWTQSGLEFLRYDVWDKLQYVGILLTPIARYLWVTAFFIGESMSEAEMIPMIVSLVMEIILVPVTFIGAYHLYKKRPIETTGTPIIYKKLSEAVKYSVMLPMTFGFGIIFQSLGGEGWGIFGFIMGGLLTFMLMNSVLNRTTKAMFSGLRGLAVFAVAAAAVFVVASSGVFGILDYTVPQAKSVTVTISGYDYEITDKALIKELRGEMKEFNRTLKKDRDLLIYNGNVYKEDVAVYNGIYTEDYHYEDPRTGTDVHKMLTSNVRTTGLNITYVNSIGAETMFKYSRVYLTELNGIKDICLRSEELKKNEPLFSADDAYRFDSTLSFTFYVDNKTLTDIIESDPILYEEYFSLIGEQSTGHYSKFDSFCVVHAEYRFDNDSFKYQNYEELYEKYSDGVKKLKESASNEGPRQSIGNVQLYSYGYNGNSVNVSSPMYFEDFALYRELIGEGIYVPTYISIDASGIFPALDDVRFNERIIKGIFERSGNDFRKNFTENVRSIEVLDTETGEIERIENPEFFEKVISRAAQLSPTATLSPFMITDNKYVVYIEMNKESDSYITYLLP